MKIWKWSNSLPKLDFYIIYIKRMDKLIMLIDIYEEEVVGVHSVGDKIIDKDEARIISKQFGFIKRLVDSDKININEGWNDYEKTNLYCNPDFFQLQQHYSYYESLLMLLAISDNPIEDLISYLK